MAGTVSLQSWNVGVWHTAQYASAFVKVSHSLRENVWMKTLKLNRSAPLPIVRSSAADTTYIWSTYVMP